MERISKNQSPWRGNQSQRGTRETRHWTQHLPNLDEVLSISLFTYFIDTFFKILFVNNQIFILKFNSLGFSFKMQILFT